MNPFQQSSNVKTQRRHSVTVYNIHKQNNRKHTLLHAALFSSRAPASSHTPPFYHFTSHITWSPLPPSPVLCCSASCYFYETVLHSSCLRFPFSFGARHFKFDGKGRGKKRRPTGERTCWAELKGTGWKQTQWGMSLLCTNLLNSQSAPRY